MDIEQFGWFEQKVWRNDSTCLDAFASSEFWIISLNIPMLSGYWFKMLRIIAIRLFESMVGGEERRDSDRCGQISAEGVGLTTPSQSLWELPHAARVGGILPIEEEF